MWLTPILALFVASLTVEAVWGAALSTNAYCPPGTSWASAIKLCVECSSGSYQPNSGAQTCLPCRLGYYCASNRLAAPTGRCVTAGYYCSLRSTRQTQHRCPRDCYCPANSASVTPYPCPVGTNSNPGARSQSECKGVTTTEKMTTEPASTASQTSTVTTTEEMTTEATSTAEPTTEAASTAEPSTEAASTTEPSTEATSTAEPSTEAASTAEPTTEAASTAEPSTVPPTLDCTPGHYAEGLSCHPCPTGTFQSAETLTENPRRCQSCTAGSYCSREGLAAPDGRCDAGYYCPQGSTSAKSVFCPQNFYCIQGSVAPTPCPNNHDSDPGSVGPSACTSPDGRNCAPGSYWHISQNHCHQCGSGTYQPTHAHGRDVEICQWCPLGHYCASTGLAAPTGRCVTAGYYCPMKSTGQTQYKCPRDFYCPANSTSVTPIPCPGATNSDPGARSQSECNAVAPVTCPDGTFINGKSCADCPKGTYLPPSTTGTACLPCDAGKYCMHPRATAVTGSCSERYYCPQGSTHPTSVVCPENHYCPVGSGTPTECPAGKVSLEGSYQLTDCNIAEKDCGPGYYTNGQSCSACPEGTYQPGWTKGKGLLQVCMQCEAGKYCKGTGLSAPTGLCAPGFYCPARSGTRTHTICPVGHYCLVGSETPIACPAGTTSVEGSTTMYECKIMRAPCAKGYYIDKGQCRPCPPGTHKNTVADSVACTECPAGSYCSRQANINPSGSCVAGYYCPGGSNHPHQHICPKDHYCGNGCGAPLPCPSGSRSYPGSTSSSQCNVNVPNECSPGYYFHNRKCNACPAGTFSPKKGRHGFEGCTPCPEGKYCENPGASRPTGDCPAGYFCPLASSSRGAIVCPPDHYCPTASPGPIQCTGGKRTLPGSTAC